jgi:HSP20 family protein
MRMLVPWKRPTEGAFDFLPRDMFEMFRRFLPETVEEAPVAWLPRVDLEETDKEIVVKADLPGVDPKEVEITVADGTLVLRGEKKEEKEEKKKQYHRMERFHGQFYREVPLPPGTDPEKIAATTAKGVITVTIPKKPEVLPKKIAIKAME